MRVEVFTLCWNEMDVLPWCIDYWHKYADHVTVFDNGSTDGSTWFLSKFEWINVVPFDSGGFNDTENQRIKNECWKNSDADYVVVCDMDECLLASDITATLQRMKEQGATICLPQWYELQAEERPKYEEGRMLHETSPMCRHFQGASKAIIFDPKAIKEMNYTPGAHRCNPEGRVKWYDGTDIFALHINHNMSLEYKLARYRELNARLSEENRIKKYGIHYAFSEEILRKAWQEDSRNAINLNNILAQHG